MLTLNFKIQPLSLSLMNAAVRTDFLCLNLNHPTKLLFKNTPSNGEKKTPDAKFRLNPRDKETRFLGALKMEGFFFSNSFVGSTFVGIFFAFP